jgi:hypothetical protein
MRQPFGVSTPVPLWLDHASVSVPVLAEAVAHLEVRLGLRATKSAADPDRHSRVYLHRSYLEVAARPGSTGWGATHFFLRFEDPQALRTHLDASGLPYRFGDYIGVDGRWDDVEIDANGIPLPILVRRTDPPEVARHWPPPLGEPHRCGAHTLAAVHIGVPEMDPALDVYRRLLACDETSSPSVSAIDGRRQARLLLASGHLVLVEAETAKIAGLVVGVTSLADTAAVMGGGLRRTPGDPVAWLDPVETFGLRLGFVEGDPSEVGGGS